MVSFFLGKGDLDISEKVLKKIAELAKNTNSKDKIIYIVPDQFESETEDAVYDILEKNELSSKEDSVNITTFSALAEKLLSESGDIRPRADDILKSVVMHKAVSELKGQLSALDRISDKQGFSEKISDTVNGFKSAGIGSIELEEKILFIETNNDKLKNTPVFKKLSDVSKIYTQYDQIIKSKDYIDSLDMIGLSAELIRKSDIFENADVFVDCFNDFTNDQLNFLCKMIEKAENVTFGFVTDGSCADDLVTDNEYSSEVFRTANQQIARLKKYAEDVGEKTEFIKDGFAERYTDTALVNIPRKLYQDHSGERVETDSCELISAPDIFGELDFVCAKIKELVETRDIRYNNIAVLCPDLSACGRYIESAFKKYDIPFFLDMRESILRQPLINAVLTLINALREFSMENVLSCIKTGFFTKLNEENTRVGLSEHDIGIFEDYIFEWALNTQHLKEPFTFTRFDAEKADSGKYKDLNMETAENIRQSVAEPLYKFHKKLKKRTKHNGAELTKNIYEYLINTVDIRCEIKAKYKANNESAPMFQRLWDALIKIFNALCKELQNYDVTIGEYYDIFRDVCLNTTLAAPPQMVDNVLVGNIDRTRAANIKAAFIIEASYDSFPAPVSNVGIFSQYETDLIHDYLANAGNGETGMDVYLKSSAEQYRLALYRAYRAVCLPTDYLCVSCSESSPSGEPMQLSPVSNEIEELFKAPNNKNIKKNISDFNDEFFCRSINSAKLRFAFGLNSDSRENEVLKRAIAMQNDDCRGFVKRLTELRTERGNISVESVKHKISPETAALLFPTSFGATIVEKIAKCKFSYFCEYGLNVKERNQRTFTASKRGDAIHYVLEKVLNYFSGDIKQFCLLKRGELYALSKKYIDEYCKIATNNSPLSDSRTHYLFENTANAVTDTLVSMQMEFSSRRYRPKFFELDLSRVSSHKILDNEQEFTAPKFDTPFYEAPLAIPPQPNKSYLPNIALNTAPLTLTLDSSTRLKIHGKIDRVDMFTDKEQNKIYLRVVDYKSSARSLDIEGAKLGINIQMLMYLSALLDANKSSGIVAGGISYLPTAGSGAADNMSNPNGLLALNHFPSGLLVLDSVTEADYSRYQEFVKSYVPNDDESNKKTAVLLDTEAIKTGSKNIVTADQTKFENIRKEVFNGIKDRFTDIFNGVIDAMPLTYKEEAVGKSAKTKCACDYCRFKSICKNNGKLTCSVESAKKPADTQNDGSEASAAAVNSEEGSK